MTNHLSHPEHSDNNAGMHTKGSKAARKSPFVGTWSSLDLTTSKYDAPQNATRTATETGETRIYTHIIVNIQVALVENYLVERSANL